MSETYTNRPDDSPGLTLETLMQARRELEAMLPEMLYRTSEYAPKTNAAGAPMLAGLPEYDWNTLEYPPPLTGRTIFVLHPDNLPRLQQAARGKYRLKEWQP